MLTKLATFMRNNHISANYSNKILRMARMAF